MLAAFGDEAQMGGGSDGSPAPRQCSELGAPFSGHSIQRVLPGEAAAVTLTDPDARLRPKQRFGAGRHVAWGGFLVSRWCWR